MPSTPQLRTVLFTFAIMALQVSRRRTSPNCSRSTWCAVTAPLRSQDNTLSTYCRSWTFFQGRNTLLLQDDRCFPQQVSRIFEPGDLVGVADAPFLRVPRGALQHPTNAAGSHPGQTSDNQVSTVSRSPDTEGITPAVPPPSQALMERLNPAQRSAFQRVWVGPPPHPREVAFDLHDPGRDPRPLSNWGMCSATFLTCSPPRRRILGPAP